MYSAKYVADYIVKKLNESRKSISNLKLQKILYFVQAEFLIDKGEPCFPERIEAWDFGPVVPEVYHEYKIYGAANIPYMKTYEPIEFSKKDKKLIDGIVDVCSDYSAAQLVDITHSQSPWQDAYYDVAGSEITTESIKDFFKDG